MEVSAEILPLLRLGRITALRKPSGGIRGIVVGDTFRRLLHAQSRSKSTRRGEGDSTVPVRTDHPEQAWSASLT